MESGHEMHFSWLRRLRFDLLWYIRRCEVGLIDDRV
jgi:hypothetical protein